MLDELAGAPPACLYYYEGLSCMQAPSPEVCKGLRERLELEPQLRIEVPARYYDNHNAHPARQGEPTVTLMLARARLSAAERR
jgi:hypothetical protein